MMYVLSLHSEAVLESIIHFLKILCGWCSDLCSFMEKIERKLSNGPIASAVNMHSPLMNNQTSIKSRDEGWNCLLGVLGSTCTGELGQGKLEGSIKAGGFFCSNHTGNIFFKIYLFLERGEGRKRVRETSVCERYSHRLPLMCPPTGDLACNPDMCPDWESNRRSFGWQAHTQSTEPHQPGFIISLKKILFI